MISHREWIDKPYQLSVPQSFTTLEDIVLNRFDFVHKHYRKDDRMINLACGTDDGEFRERYGAVNVDAHAHDIYLDKPTAVDYECDIRMLPDHLKGCFDCAVLGDVMEHCDSQAGPELLLVAKETIVDTGVIMIIFPEDVSGIHYMKNHPAQKEFYAPGIYSYHRYPPLNKQEMVEWLELVGLHLIEAEDLWYPPTPVSEDGKIYPGVGYGIIVAKDI
jgi:hypothetical protein